MKINFSEPKLTKNELKNTDWVLKNNWILNETKKIKVLSYYLIKSLK